MKGENTLADILPAEAVKYFVAILYPGGQDKLRQQAQSKLSALYGEIDHLGCDHPFDVTNYYAPEMGDNLCRRLVGFAELLPPENIVRAKHDCNQIEDDLRVDYKRTVNLDIGYLDHNKVVLASAKAAGQKIYLGDGIYADLVARYQKGRYRPFEWTFMDFKDDRYHKDLMQLRSLYLCARKSID
jgi:hypothetical protein